MADATSQIRAGERFAFGENWRRFLADADESRLEQAVGALRATLGREHLSGLTFCDVGSGSGLHSVAAARLGADVVAFDFDPASVACTAELARRFGVEVDCRQGSVLDEPFVASLGRFDVVYSWGVLHHTGDQWRALDLVSGLVAPGGRLLVALYNDQGLASRNWVRVKRLYHRAPGPLRGLVAAAVLVRLWALPSLRDLARGRPFETWRSYGRERGMSPWIDVVDWAGGWPFEVSRPGDVVGFHLGRGYVLERLETATGLGCNEYVFRRPG